MGIIKKLKPMQLALPTTENTQPRITSARRPTIPKKLGPVIGCHDIDVLSQHSINTSETKHRFISEKMPQNHKNLSVFQLDDSTRCSSSAKTLKPMDSAQSSKASSAFNFPCEYAFSDAASNMAVYDFIPDEELSPLSRHRKELKAEKEHEARLDRIRKDLKIGKYKEKPERIELRPTVKKSDSVSEEQNEKAEVQ